MLQMRSKVAFRVDASLEIGTGHVMRCLTLADALRTRGAECHFISHEHPGHLLELVRQRSFQVTVLPACEPGEDGNAKHYSLPPHVGWLDCDWQTDAEQTANILAKLTPNWLVVDHYALDSLWEEALREHYEKLMVIDDLADRPHVCDLLLDQNLGKKVEDYAGLVPPHCVVLVGPQYALLRPEFADLRECSLKRREVPQLKRLLISMGGVDQPNATGQVLEALKECPLLGDCQITVVMGGQAPWLTHVHELAATMPWSVNVLINIGNMAQVMADSDLAIGAAGSTSWERGCLGLPTLVVVLAKNQKAIAEAIRLTGAAMVLPIENPLDFSASIKKAISSLVSDTTGLERMIAAAAAITDGEGVHRVAGYLWSH